MTITVELSIDLRNQGFPQLIRATQADANTRIVEVSLYDGGVAWPVPDGVAAAVGYRKPDGTAGLYDKLPDGSEALTISENTVTAILAPQVLTAPGIVSAVIILTDDSMRQLSTFPFQIYVEKNPAAGLVASDNYINVVDAIGDLNTLVTEDKTSLVAAINEIARNNGGTISKEQIAQAVADYLAENPIDGGYSTTTEITDESTDEEVPTAAAVREYVGQHSGGNAELKGDLVDLYCAVFNVKTGSDLTWIIGAIAKADGRPVTMDTRIRTVRFMANGGSVKPSNGYMIAVAVYSSDGWDGFEKYVEFSTTEYKFESGKYYVIIIKDVNDSSYTDDSISTVVSNIDVMYWNDEDKIESLGNNFASIEKTVNDLKSIGLSSKLNFSVGGLNEDGSINDNVERLHSDVIFVRKGSKIRLKPAQKMKFAVYKYSDEFGNGFISSNALSLNDYEFTDDSYVRILIESGDISRLKEINFDLFSFDLKELNNYVKYTELTQWVDTGYITISDVGDYTKFVITHTKEWSFMVLPVHTGDKFIIHGYGGNNSRLYAFTDKFGKVLERTEKTGVVQKLVITSPSDGYVIFNVLRSNEHQVIKFNTNVINENSKRNLIVPPYMPSAYNPILSVPNSKTSAMSYEEIMTAWENLRQKYPNYITRTLLGKDTSGTLDMYRYDFKPEIVLLSGSVQSGMNKIYTKDDYPIVIMDACIHGAERPCAKALLNLMELIADAKDYSILGWMRNNIHFVIVPIANPWGYKNNSRTNVNHVDINRNFEPLWEHGSSDSTDDRFRGTSPLSEKESQYIDAVLSECSEKAVCYYSFHTHGLFTGYNAMTNFSSPALFMLNDMQNIGMSVTKMITASGWTNHNLPQDSGYIGQMEMAYSAMASYQGALHGIPSACPEVMYRYYDGGTSEIYNTDVDCMNTEYILYAVANACKKFLYLHDN